MRQAGGTEAEEAGARQAKEGPRAGQSEPLREEGATGHLSSAQHQAAAVDVCCDVMRCDGL